jgi:hypothetical protein
VSPLVVHRRLARKTKLQTIQRHNESISSKLSQIGAGLLFLTRKKFNRQATAYRSLVSHKSKIRAPARANVRQRVEYSSVKTLGQFYSVGLEVEGLELRLQQYEQMLVRLELAFKGAGSGPLTKRVHLLEHRQEYYQDGELAKESRAVQRLGPGQDKRCFRVPSRLLPEEELAACLFVFEGGYPGLVGPAPELQLEVVSVGLQDEHPQGHFLLQPGRHRAQFVARSKLGIGGWLDYKCVLRQV